MTNAASISIPENLLPADGRFNSGPSKVPIEALNALAATGQGVLGTSHRKPGIKDLVGRMQQGIVDMYDLPDDWEIVLGNGGATGFWDCATFGLIEQKSQHIVCGEFSSKFAKAAASAPHIGEPDVIDAEVGTSGQPVADDSVDLYALIHNETSTGVVAELVRPSGPDNAIVAVDATSAAAGVEFDPAQVDVYYFSLQKGLASEGGLWVAACSPKGVGRIESLSATDRWIPTSLDLQTALNNSRKNQTYNTPSLSGIFLAVEMIDWVNENGGISFSAGRSKQSSDILYSWAESREWASPFVSNPADRSPVVTTIDIDDRVVADDICDALAANGVTGTDSYRKLGRNQLRIAAFPAIDPVDVEALTGCIDHVVDALS